MNAPREPATYKIRPAGRHVLTIGRELIQDSYAAIVELVKNAYDADSADVSVEFRLEPASGGFSIIVIDNGHGMSRDTVINKWMVPSTPDKLDRRVSPYGRIMQGRKGVGRYAASILGADLLLETVTVHGEKTSALFNWADFEAAPYLDDVEILIETTTVSEPPGTRLTITGGREFVEQWNQEQFDKLRFELKKLMSPVRAAVGDGPKKDDFRISLQAVGIPGTQDVDEVIKPYPIFDLFDYRITGKIAADGNGELVYSLQKARNTTEETIQLDAGGPTGCGELFFDIRAYDREKEAIDSLIARGLTDEKGSYVGKLQARQILNEYNGIGVYRNGFRIRPLGDADFDWLKLNEQRVQNPSLRIGSNQVIGYVQIQSDELSGLVEKSARDGLRENGAFVRLKEITKTVIAKLEERRFSYRRKAGLSRPALKVERQLEQLFSYDSLEKDVRSRLANDGVGQGTAEAIAKMIERDAEDKNRVADEIRQTVAVYQGQATLGKIINVILHEGRRPLSYFRNEIPNLHYWYDAFVKVQEIKALDKFMLSADGVAQNAEIFVSLFDRLDPLAAGKRGNKKSLDLEKIIRQSLAIFDEKIKLQGITVKILGSGGTKFQSWQQDIYAVFTNLIDNSIYWMNEKKISKQEIVIDLKSDGELLLHIDYQDSGPGIEPDLIASEVIFEPQFTTKPSGTGLGLAIAGEAAARNGLELRALESKHGAWFRLQPKMEDQYHG